MQRTVQDLGLLEIKNELHLFPVGIGCAVAVVVSAFILTQNCFGGV